MRLLQEAQTLQNEKNNTDTVEYADDSIVILKKEKSKFIRILIVRVLKI